MCIIFYLRRGLYLIFIYLYMLVYHDFGFSWIELGNWPLLVTDLSIERAVSSILAPKLIQHLIVKESFRVLLVPCTAIQSTVGLRIFSSYYIDIKRVRKTMRILLWLTLIWVWGNIQPELFTQLSYLIVVGRILRYVRKVFVLNLMVLLLGLFIRLRNIVRDVVVMHLLHFVLSGFSD